MTNDSRLEYWEAMAKIAQARTLVAFRRAIYEVLKAIEFGGVYFVAPVVADRRVGRVFWNVGFPKELTCPPKSGPFWELENRLFTA